LKVVNAKTVDAKACRLQCHDTMKQTSAEKLLKNPGALCNMIKRIAREAGDITLDYFETNSEFESKHDGSPVTVADRAAEEFIYKSLKELLPGVPVIGEEAAAKGALPDLSGAEYFWLVDPLDGTKEFISGGGDYTVNIGLIHNGVPILGVVYAPVKGVLYAGHAPGGAVRWLADTDNEKAIRVRRPPKEGITVIIGLRDVDERRLDKFLQDFKVEKTIRRGSSLKLCLVAEGKADLYPRLGPIYQWDTAAGEAVLRAAGGYLTDLNGHVLRYGANAENFRTPEFIASSFEWPATVD
jgi:3'(2'), 5'-bisphosphate nucleotidase